MQPKKNNKKKEHLLVQTLQEILESLPLLVQIYPQIRGPNSKCLDPLIGAYRKIGTPTGVNYKNLGRI